MPPVELLPKHKRDIGQEEQHGDLDKRANRRSESLVRVDAVDGDTHCDGKLEAGVSVGERASPDLSMLGTDRRTCSRPR